jgi:hypothetical protein
MIGILSGLDDPLWNSLLHTVRGVRITPENSSYTGLELSFHSSRDGTLA